MKKILFFLAALVGMTLAGCIDEKFVGDLPPSNTPVENEEAILFGFDMQKVTRGDIVGSAAATLLGNSFYVAGTKGSEGEKNPSETLVFDNYLVHYSTNTAGTTESNTANWEYVGITPGASDYTNWVKLSALDRQTIKYWDYTQTQYDFHAFSTGTFKAVSKNDLSQSTATTDDDVATDEIGVTAMKYGAGLKDAATAYTFYIPTIDALKSAFITDITTVAKANYGQEVQLRFKNLGSKIRVALYETVPGYSIQASSVKFYAVDAADAGVNDLGESTTSAATLISAGTYGFPQKGTIVVSFPNVGTTNASNQNYKKASVSVTPVAVSSTATTQTFGTLASVTYADKEGSETTGASYLGRSLPTATYAGVEAVDYYQVVFPITGTNAAPLTLRVDYTLISTDGSGETINVYGAKAVVPATYTVWQPNYAYTYVFKISDNTNGWTSKTATGEATDPAGLFPITFDAVVAEIKDVSGEQTTITTVATPTITTYQQNHDKSKDEYSIATKKDVYVQVMDNTTAPATLKTDLNGTATGATTKKSLLYAVTSGKTYATQPAGWPTGYYTDEVCNTAASGDFSSSTTYYKRCTEADVMDALENQSTEVSGTITGRNGVVLTPNDNIDATVKTIVNGVDDKVIDLGTDAGKAAKIAITADGFAAGTYAYVYDYSDDAKTTTTIYQPTGQTTGKIASGTKYITCAALNGITNPDFTTANEDVSAEYVYFTKTTTDGTNYTYSFVSVDGKKKLPAGLMKVSVSTGLSTGDGIVDADANTFVFDTYIRNTGKYAVKVIKVVA